MSEFFWGFIYLFCFLSFSVIAYFLFRVSLSSDLPTWCWHNSHAVSQTRLGPSRHYVFVFSAHHFPIYWPFLAHRSTHFPHYLACRWGVAKGVIITLWCLYCTSLVPFTFSHKYILVLFWHHHRLIKIKPTLWHAGCLCILCVLPLPASFLDLPHWSFVTITECQCAGSPVPLPRWWTAELLAFL